MPHTLLLEFCYIWLDISTLIARYIDIAKKTLLPGVLWWIADVEYGDIATGLEVRAIDLSTGTMIVKIPRELLRKEVLHEKIVAESWTKSKNYSTVTSTMIFARVSRVIWR
jgi:hypothetical protein